MRPQYLNPHPDPMLLVALTTHLSGKPIFNVWGYLLRLFHLVPGIGVYLSGGSFQVVKNCISGILNCRKAHHCVAM